MLGGKPALINSKHTQKYKQDSQVFWRSERFKFKQLLEGKAKPYRIGFYFIRTDRRLFDYINPAQTVQDIMVNEGWIDDDNCDEMIPVFLGHHVDKLTAGVIISVL